MGVTQGKNAFFRASDVRGEDVVEADVTYLVRYSVHLVHINHFPTVFEDVPFQLLHLICRSGYFVIFINVHTSSIFG